ncbi:MAG: hypothetical protein JRI59_10380 [Deltaproteobacteria bacterium]|nr:hypothetical protein [Deltaproteobacteria bacterium]
MSHLPHLVVFDTDRIQEFVFATTTLKEIRGASGLLDELNRLETLKLIAATSGSTVYLGGGSGLVRFSHPASAQGFCRKLEALYRDEAPGASITTRWEPRRDGEKAREWLARAERHLRRRKDERGRPPPLVRLPYLQVCDLCGCQPAYGPRPRDPTRLVCSACLTRLQGGHSYKHSLVYQRLEDILGTDLVRWPEDMEEIGQASRPSGYAGLIYADGNRMGLKRQEFLDRHSGDDEALFRALGDFSRALDVATRGAVVQAVHQHLGGAQAGTVYPVQFFITGGDDLAAVVPAHLAVPVALDFCRFFQELFLNGGQVGKEEIPCTGLEASMSVGVAIAKDRFPLHRLLATGRELLKSAKVLNRELYGQGLGEVATLDFLVTSAPLLEPLEEQRRALEEDGLRRYQRPYTREALERLVKRIRRLKDSGFPRNKVPDLATFLFQGRLQACLDYLVLLSRLSKEGDPSPRQALLETAHDFNLMPFPWREVSGRLGEYETPMLDLVELYDFIR